MSDDRRLRGDSRSNHLSAAEITRRASGPVRQLTPEEIAAMEPTKPTPAKVINVTLTDEEARQSLSWEEQQEELRKACSIMVSDAVSAIKGRRPVSVDPRGVEIANQLSNIVKRHLTEKRQSGDSGIDYENLPLDKLAAAANGAQK